MYLEVKYFIINFKRAQRIPENIDPKKHSRGTSIKGVVLRISPLLTLLAIFCLQAFFLHGPFKSDESIYAYAGYAIASGTIPYSGIQLAQPPSIYLILATLIHLVGPILLALYILKGFLLAFTGFLIYVNVSKLNPVGTGRLMPLIALLIYCCFTIIYYYVTLLEVLFTSILMTALTIYIHLLRNKSNHRLIGFFVMGLIFGFALMTKYISFFLILVVLIFNISLSFFKKKYKKAITECSAMIAGLILTIIFFILLISFVWGAFSQFYLQTMYWQTIRWSMSFSQRLDILCSFLSKSAIMLIFALVGAVFIFLKIRRLEYFLSPILWISGLIIIPFSLNFFADHYIYHLVPLLTISCVIGLQTAINLLHIHFKVVGRKQLLTISFLLLFVTCFMIQVGVSILVYEPPEIEINSTIGNYISQITTPEDKIWTSEGAIGFFAKRQIAIANSTDWPVACAYADIFSYNFTAFMGANMKDYKNGILTPQQFTQSWDTSVKVIVLIEGIDWVPYPDNLLLSGVGNYPSIVPYLEQNYLLNRTILSPNGMLLYKIWVRK